MKIMEELSKIKGKNVTEPFLKKKKLNVCISG